MYERHSATLAPRASGHQAARPSVLPSSGTSRRAFRHGASGLLSRSIFSMTFASVAGSLATPYRTLPLRERTSVTHPHGPLEFRSVTRLPLVTAVPAQVVAFARLFAPPLRVRVAEKIVARPHSRRIPAT